MILNLAIACLLICGKIAMCGESAIVYELDGNIYSESRPNPKPERKVLHGWNIDSVYQDVNDAKLAKIVSIVDDRSSIDAGLQIMCFQPGFGFTVNRDGKRLDYLICLDCRNMTVYMEGKVVRREETFTMEAFEELKNLVTALISQLSEQGAAGQPATPPRVED